MMTKLLASLGALASIGSSSAFVPPSYRGCVTTASTDNNRQHTPLFMSTTTIPGTETEEKTETEKREIPGEGKIPSGESQIRGPVEWLIDDALVSRETEDPFHILLLDETFTKNKRMTIEYVATSCSYVLGMPYDESAELASHAEKEGFSCLGTWGHEECLRLGKQLQERDLICRVVPFCEGGDRAWQARNAKDEAWEFE
mmetsp:Transcript_26004/g.47157  ORF Transcript_26004/g.47157 Transcript_26004/m.47157 type:complete len:200 (-) Transcript_26004:199-798(-)|eukprot:CAMPEP_0201607244 /NCGR_PEP_ID=MMETSP0492-20130828/6419_1 /ASSEMBLY_ACC=CAM_ASM_000837 /TAXON_ID=420259 /ORGANISM="Thalassiosira gravida, Strain GMp14c1" /LENGTH=199 /DNA_ID=CAMNT_0048071795 /DNA_START=106 /DNA_END=705 /DNA_ORIENTATION=-